MSNLEENSCSCVDLNVKVDDGTEEFRCKSEATGCNSDTIFYTMSCLYCQQVQRMCG